MVKDESSDRDMLPLDPFLHRVSLVIGKPLSGKSLFLKFLAENAVRLQHSVGILDPNGDHADLRGVGLDVFWGADMLPDPLGLKQLLGAFGTGFVLDLSSLGQIAKGEYLDSALKLILAFKKETGHPALLIVDEAHGLSRLESDDGKFKLVRGLCISSFIPTGISTPIITSVTTFVVNRTSFQEVRKLRGRVKNPLIIDSCLETIQKLSPEDAFAIISEGLENPAIIQFSTMMRHLKSHHVRQRNLFWSGYLPKEDCFYFVEPDSNIVVQANNLQEVCQAVETISSTSLIHHLLRNDLSRWAENVIGDKELARQFVVVESGTDDLSIRQIRAAIRSAIQSRYAPAQ